MKRILSLKGDGKILSNPHFWAIIVISLFLILIYQAWPWRIWRFNYGMWQWVPWLSSLYSLALVELVYRICGIFFLIPIIYAAIVFSWKGALAAFLLSLAGVLPIIISVWSISHIITNLLILLLPLLIVLIVSFELAWRHKERRIFAEREAERQLYSSKVTRSDGHSRSA